MKAPAKKTAVTIDRHASQPRAVFTGVSKRRPLLASASVVKYPVSSEKAIRLMESENKLVFVVDQKANKPAIKKAVLQTFLERSWYKFIAMLGAHARVLERYFYCLTSSFLTSREFKEIHSLKAKG